MDELPKAGTERICYEGRVIRVVEFDLQHPSGRVTRHATVRHPGAVVILPQDADGSIILLRQYRAALGRVILELPAGTLDPREEPLACARREIREETKLGAAEWVSLGTLVPVPGFCDELQHCFLARGLSPAPLEEDDDEIIEIERVSVSRLEKWIADGVVDDSKTIALFTRARLRGLL